MKIESLSRVVLFLFLISLPFFVYGQPTTANTGITYECVSGTVYGNCTFIDLVKATKKVIDWAIIFTLQFSVVVIVWAGFNYMISGDNASKRAEANKMLRKVAMGIFFVLAAWMIVTLIANTLLTQAIKNVVPLVTNP